MGKSNITAVTLSWRFSRIAPPGRFRFRSPLLFLLAISNLLFGNDFNDYLQFGTKTDAAKDKLDLQSIEILIFIFIIKLDFLSRTISVQKVDLFQNEFLVQNPILTLGK